jgi:DNA-binding MarR family transcriptional regulator
MLVMACRIPSSAEWTCLPVNDSRATHGPLGLVLRLALQHWTQAVESALAEAGFGDIRPPHANVFTFVRPSGIPVSELTRLSHVRKQTMAQVVDELEQLGYVERRPDPNDRRARLVFLTKRGEAVRPVAMAASRRVEARWSKLMGPPNLESLRRSLQDLVALLDEAPTRQV